MGKSSFVRARCNNETGNSVFPSNFCRFSAVTIISAAPIGKICISGSGSEQRAHHFLSRRAERLFVACNRPCGPSADFKAPRARARYRIYSEARTLNYNKRRRCVGSALFTGENNAPTRGNFKHTARP